MRNKIYLYSSYGTSGESLIQTTNFLRDFISQKYQIKSINGFDIRDNDEWMNDAKLLIIPGGLDKKYCERLNGIGNQKIKSYVENGGSYLGVCAGGYYGANNIEFDKGSKYEIIEPRELKFFPGKAIGPMVIPYAPKSREDARAMPIFVPQMQKTIKLFVQGGGYFEDADQFSNVNVIAYYENDLPAMIHIKVGQGNVVLSGPHFEYDPNFLFDHDEYIAKIIPELQKNEQNRKQLIQIILESLEIS